MIHVNNFNNGQYKMHNRVSYPEVEIMCGFFLFY